MKNTSQQKSFKISYDTPETADHTMDAEELGGSLISLSKVIKNADKLLNGEDSEVDVEVKAHNEGSYELEIITWLKDGGIDILQALGFSVVGGAFTSGTLIGLIKAIKGRKIEAKTQQQDNQVRLTLEDNDTITCSKEVASLISNYAVVKDLEDVILKPTKGSSSGSVKLINEAGEIGSVEVSEADYFKAPPRSAMREETEHEEEREAVFTVVALESPTGWKLKLPPDDTEYTVKMADERFLERVNDGDKQFVKGELFKLKLKTIERELDGKTTYTRIVTEVLRHRTSADRKII